ncbi:MAG: hypothetical protein MRY63_13550 [Neomegalonema sp.]|nr:hypothetical protein [Neomegalonema sp.]
MSARPVTPRNAAIAAPLPQQASAAAAQGRVADALTLWLRHHELTGAARSAYRALALAGRAQDWEQVLALLPLLEDFDDALFGPAVQIGLRAVAQIRPSETFAYLHQWQGRLAAMPGTIEKLPNVLGTVGAYRDLPDFLIWASPMMGNAPLRKSVLTQISQAAPHIHSSGLDRLEGIAAGWAASECDWAMQATCWLLHCAERHAAAFDLAGRMLTFADDPIALEQSAPLSWIARALPHRPDESLPLRSALQARDAADPQAPLAAPHVAPHVAPLAVVLDRVPVSAALSAILPPKRDLIFITYGPADDRMKALADSLSARQDARDQQDGRDSQDTQNTPGRCQIVDILRDHADLYDREMVALSDFCGAMAANLTTQISDSLPAPLADLPLRDFEGVALGLDDRMFPLLHRYAAIERFLRMRQIPEILFVTRSAAGPAAEMAVAQSALGEEAVLQAILSPHARDHEPGGEPEAQKRHLGALAIETDRPALLAACSEHRKSGRALGDTCREMRGRAALMISVDHRVFTPIKTFLKEGMLDRRAMLHLQFGSHQSAVPQIDQPGADSEGFADRVVMIGKASAITAKIPEAALARAVRHAHATLGALPAPMRAAPWPILSRKLSEAMVHFLTRDFEKLILTDHFIQGLRDTLAPASMIALPSRNPQIRMAGVVMMESHVPVFEVQSVYLSKKPRYRKPLCDLFFSIDTFSSGEILHGHLGLPLENISTAGSLRLETLVRQIRQGPEAAEAEAHRAAAERLQVMIVTQPLELRYNLQLIDWTCAALKSIGALADITVKMHPAEPDADIALYERAMAPHQPNLSARITKSENPYIVALRSDLVVTQNSNLAMEAALLNRDTVVVDHFDRETYIPMFEYERMGVAMVVHDAPGVQGAISQIVQDGPERAELIARRRAYFAANPLLRDGGALEHIFATMERWLAA